MKEISAQIVADSINEFGNRITSFILTYPRFIHPELMTHRLFSRNSASSRAIPFEKMVEMVNDDPFIPIAWQKDHKGMQGNEYITGEKELKYRTDLWLQARDNAIRSAKKLNNEYSYPNNDFDSSYEDGGVTKQLSNRLLEPFMWHTVLVTATEFENFFNLRCPKYEVIDQLLHEKTFRSRKDVIKYVPDHGFEDYTDLNWIEFSKSQAEIHIQALAEAMWDAMNESIPKKLKEGEWHIPFGDDIDESELMEGIPDHEFYLSDLEEKILQVSTARCARLSYMTFDGEIDYGKDIKLHNHLLNNHHMSPFEHCAVAMTKQQYYQFRKGYLTNSDESIENVLGWCNNFRGFIQYRYIVEDGQIRG